MALERLTKDNFVDHPPFFTVYDYWYNELVDAFNATVPSLGEGKLDSLSEYTSGAGVDIEGVVLKDDSISLTSGVAELTKMVSLTSANLLAMNATPVTVVAAPGAGYALDFVSAVLIYDSTLTAYVNGGVITINYGSGGAAVSTNLAATFLTGAGDKVYNMQKLNAAGGYTMPVNTGLVITNAAAPFITGTGVCRLYITYKVYTTNL